MNIIGFLTTARTVSYSTEMTDNVDDFYDLISRTFTNNGAVVESREE